MNLIKEWDNRAIRIRTDRYVSLTDMAKSVGKQLGHWNTLISTKSYLATLSGSIAIPIDQLVQVNESSGTNEERGTWGHPKVALRFAQWCSDEFAVQVDIWIDELMTTGKVELTPAPVPQPLQLPPADVRLANYAQALEKMSDLGILDIHNPRITQHIKDVAANIFISHNQLPASSDVWLGVAEKAEQLGYAPNVVLKCRSALGKFVRKKTESDPKIKHTSEKRLVNGTMREINLYLDNSHLAQAINAYFG